MDTEHRQTNSPSGDNDRERLSESLQGKDAKRMQLAAHVAKLGVFEWDMIEDKAFWENEQIFKIFGRSAEDGPLSGKDFVEDYLHPEDVNSLSDAIQSAIRSKDYLFFQCRIVPKSQNRPIWVEITGELECTEDGTPSRLIGFIRDITEIRRAEDKLRQAAEMNAFRIRLADGLRQMDDTEKIKSEAARLLGLELQADQVFYAQLGPGGEYAIVPENYYAQRSLPSVSGRQKIADHPHLFAIRQQQATIVDDIRVEKEIPETLHSWYHDLEIRAFVAYPLFRNNAPEAIFCITQAEPREWTEYHLELIRETAERMQTAIERVIAETSLRASEHQLRLITDTLPTMISYLDKDHHYRFVNRMYENWFNIRREDIVGRHAREILGESAYQAVFPYIKRVLSGEAFTFEQTFDYNNAGKRYVRVNFIPDEWEDGQVKGWYAMVQDFTERKAAEQRLIESEEQLKQMANAMPQVVWMTDAVGQIYYSNERSERLFGVSKDDTGWDMDSVTHPDEREATLAAWKKAVSKKSIFTYEHRLRMQDGSYCWHLCRGIPGLDQDGEIQKWYFTATDINKLKKAQQALATSEAYFRKLADAAPVFIWQSGINGEYYYFNKGWLAYTGRALEVKQGIGLNDLVHPDDRKRWQDIYQQSFEQRQAFEREFRLKKHDGTYRWMLDHGVPTFDLEGTFNGYVGSCIDVHERKTVQEQKDIFVRVGGHELRTPLTSMLGYLSLAKRSMDLSQPAGQFIQKSHESALRLRTLIQDFLDTYRMQQGDISYDMSELEFDQLVHRTIENIQSGYPRHSIRTEGQTGMTIHGDQNKLEKVIANLVNNAIKYSPDKDHIDLILRNEKGFARLTVKDYGIGINPQEIPDIFSRFHRAGNTGKTTGMGLGLFLVKQIIDHHKGKIEVSSTPQEGSSFTVSLPVS
ncbi:sensor histidine kinase [Flavilitoribacter nigricans]|uniref:histidine kinase n=1 Tax=Flavilitoribacter nigricans (strain ATCC 23147 / DSM 23189 / NBRC 102662 / NCIMB 1420 / SS-2) TaxID=1122177 RepID=A0A2D0MZM0_FLAN2|nr:PAS domain S-box protein [Flavilitoribacter nigricans]PHN01667.1 hypothetical protein CRP01_36225 [Flavilitoribacter nigricans DSM 23189 = NBRC 102662]